ncbi:hypothetical protein DACRYDRAFT_13049 [Dacryopinax primogenitus]|uniref:Uncharacterized protein n=1 Tax=Dacryopinax primogenitus (strain DJM 731) TaxID=1858805 RepID=M5GFJ5_DACPD|nr:uncharacterized protein DACRYDRAFT_13049 [Dacryopinax primogenitus]EJU06367.1 hypothetical protein DACRYDRAFT_13049 [Dacryopinax primogenitus]
MTMDDPGVHNIRCIPGNLVSDAPTIPSLTAMGSPDAEPSIDSAQLGRDDDESSLDLNGHHDFITTTHADRLRVSNIADAATAVVGAAKPHPLPVVAYGNCATKWSPASNPQEDFVVLTGCLTGAERAARCRAAKAWAQASPASNPPEDSVVLTGCLTGAERAARCRPAKARAQRLRHAQRMLNAELKLNNQLRASDPTIQPQDDDSLPPPSYDLFCSVVVPTSDPSNRERFLLTGYKTGAERAQSVGDSGNYNLSGFPPSGPSSECPIPASGSSVCNIYSITASQVSLINPLAPHHQT